MPYLPIISEGSILRINAVMCQCPLFMLDLITFAETLRSQQKNS